MLDRRQFAEDALWPDECPTWTSAVLLAVDALTEYSPACRLFTTVALLGDLPVAVNRRTTQLVSSWSVPARLARARHPVWL